MNLYDVRDETNSRLMTSRFRCEDALADAKRMSMQYRNRWFSVMRRVNGEYVVCAQYQNGERRTRETESEADDG